MRQGCFPAPSGRARSSSRSEISALHTPAQVGPPRADERSLQPPHRGAFPRLDATVTNLDLIPSVPASSGRSRNLREHLPREGRPLHDVHSVPSSSGRSRNWAWPTNHEIIFDLQSPHHRGGHSTSVSRCEAPAVHPPVLSSSGKCLDDSQRRVRAGDARVPSVPSSSGKPLNSWPRWASKTGSRRRPATSSAFSPLTSSGKSLNSTPQIPASMRLLEVV
jgi:hypothetical protein